MARARGANALAAGAFETSYGVTPGGVFYRLPFVSSQLGEERPLIASDLLGQGREMQDPTYDVATNDGDFVVPVDLRCFWLWLKLMFGAPSTSGSGAKASNVLSATANFADGDTVTIGGKVYTLQAALTNTDGHVKIGASEAASITNLYHAINASGGVAGTDYAASTLAHPTVSATASTGTTLTVTARSGGTGGNSIGTTDASTVASWATATLAGGSVATHVFTSGAASLSSMSIEIGNPEVPAYGVNFGARANQMKISMSRSGLLNATMSLVAQGESPPSGTSAAGSPTALVAQRFAQATGGITRDGVVLGSVVSADFTASNNLDKVETIRPDGRIGDADPAMFGMSGTITTRFDDLGLYNLAANGTPCGLTFGWTLGEFSLIFGVPRVFLPRVKRPITGPAGVLAQFNWQSSGALGPACTATLVNDINSYA